MVCGLFLIGLFVDSLTGLLLRWFVVCLLGWFVAWVVCWFVGSLGGMLLGLFLAVWLVNWVVVYLGGFFMRQFPWLVQRPQQKVLIDSLSRNVSKEGLKSLTHLSKAH